MDSKEKLKSIILNLIEEQNEYAVEEDESIPQSNRRLSLTEIVDELPEKKRLDRTSSTK